MKKPKQFRVLTCVLPVLLCACASQAVTSEALREHDKRQGFLSATPEQSFAPLAGLNLATDRWSGVLGGAIYRIEIPKQNWDGKLAVYAHGYVGKESTLAVQNPPIRRYLIENGYAWAASSYSKNFYDVQADRKSVV